MNNTTHCNTGSALEAIRGLLRWRWEEMTTILGLRQNKSYWKTINGARSPRDKEFDRLVRAGVNRPFLHDQTEQMLSIPREEFIENANRELEEARRELGK